MKEYGIKVPCDMTESAQIMEQQGLVINAVN